MSLSTKCHRRRTVLITMTLFLLSFIFMLNIMVEQLQRSNLMLQQDFHDGEFSMDTGMSDTNFGHAMGRMQRKPKAAYEKFFGDNSQSKQLNNNDNVISNSAMSFHPGYILNKLLNVKIDFHTVSSKDRKVKQINKDEEEEDYVYQEDIYKVVIEDTDDSDEEDDEDDEDMDDENHKNNNLEGNQLPYVLQNKDGVQTHYRTKANVPYGKSTALKHIQSDRSNNNSMTMQDIIENGIYWSKKVENLTPKGDSFAERMKYITSVREQNVQRLDPPAWDKCGRPKNGFVTLQDGRHMCARYRAPHNKMVLGEVLSFYLSQFLGMDSVPAVVLAETNHSTQKWKATNFQALDWNDGNIVALIQWIPNLEPYSSLVKLPEIILRAYWQKSVIDRHLLEQESANMLAGELSELSQWGQMILFDYLTGNYDRIASMQDAALKENKPSILSENIRNLRKSTQTSKLWLIDNESGLLDAYDLMYNVYGGEKFIKFHKEMLQTFCIFPKKFIESLERLSTYERPHNFLEQYAIKYDSLVKHIPRDSTYTVFQTNFKTRINDILDWVKTCDSKGLT